MAREHRHLVAPAEPRLGEAVQAEREAIPLACRPNGEAQTVGSNVDARERGEGLGDGRHRARA
jgi:hypothetical protein